MCNLEELLSYLVKIKCGDKVGSGIIYVPNNCEFAYVFTVAHNFPSLEKEFVFEVFFELRNVNREYEYKPQKSIKGNRDSSCKIVFLEGYNPNWEASPNDGAVIEIKRESWMEVSKYNLGRANMQDELEGIGYPKTGEGDYMEFECWVLQTPDLDEKDKDRDYRIRYDIDKYKEIMSTDTCYLNGYSGMGLFLKRKNNEMLQMTALFSRDAGTTGLLFLTDAIRLYELAESMISGHPVVYPKAEYIDYNDLLKENAISKEADLNIILEKVFHNKDDYFRCLCGYIGVGKSYTLNLVKNYSSRYVFEYSWTKLMSCLKAKNLKVLENTIYILDPLEQLLSKAERKQLLSIKSSNKDLERLNTEEKMKLFEVIEENSQNLKRYNIHILFICHSFFWKDVEIKLAEHNSRKSQKLKNCIINCSGYNKCKVKKILEMKGLSDCPDYFYDIPLIRRPRWLFYVIENRDELPKKNEHRHEYEFRLYDGTLDWFEKIGDVQGGLKPLEDHEVYKLESLLKKYLEDDMTFRGHRRLSWDIEYFYLICSYPFDEDEKGFQISDFVLRAYLIAHRLYNYAKDSKEDDFILYFMNVYEMARNDPQLEQRIPFFLSRFLQNGKPEGVANNVERWLREDYKDCYNWLYDGNIMLLKRQDKEQEREYLYNTKDGKLWINTKELSEKNQVKLTVNEENEEKKNVGIKIFSRNNNLRS